jgi:hypothetical protein
LRCDLLKDEFAGADAMRLVGLGAEPPVALGLVRLERALEETHLRIAPEREDVGREAVEEPAIVSLPLEIASQTFASPGSASRLWST